jgi:hypothetical protein
MVAGTAALILSRYPSLNTASIKATLLDGTNEIDIFTPSGWQSVRRLNAYGALNILGFDGGTGTPCDPYLVSNEKHLKIIGDFGAGANFTLTSNINLSNTPWLPIPSFHGTLNGNNHIISNMTISRPGTSLSSDLHLGLFATLYGTITNLTIYNSSITVSSHHAGSAWLYTGILAGVMESATATNIHIHSSSITIHRCLSSTGGITGHLRNSTISNSTVEYTTLSANGDTGGVVAHTNKL